MLVKFKGDIVEEGGRVKERKIEEEKKKRGKEREREREREREIVCWKDERGRLEKFDILFLIGFIGESVESKHHNSQIECTKGFVFVYHHLQFYYRTTKLVT